MRFKLHSFCWMIPWRLNFIFRRFGTLCHIFIGDVSTAYADVAQCSETSAYKIQTPGNHQNGRIRYSEHDESLKSRLNSSEMRRCVVWRVVLDVSKDFIAVGLLAPEDETTTKVQELLARRHTTLPRKLESPATPLR